jgi:hypothetical protein
MSEQVGLEQFLYCILNMALKYIKYATHPSECNGYYLCRHTKA